MTEKETSSTSEANIAYFILVHRLPVQFKRLFKAIYHPDNHYLIHIDKKSTVSTLATVKNFLSDFPNTYILPSEDVVWGGYSMVQAELNGMQFLLDLSVKWDFFINLSGQDFPLKSQQIIKAYLSKHRDTSFIKIANQRLCRPETLNRIESFYVEKNNCLSGALFERNYLQNTVPYIGGQWMILTRNCCEFICTSKEVQKFEDYYINTLIADESFFQTVLMNSSFSGKIVNDDKRAIIWVPDGIIKLRPKTFLKTDLGFLLKTDNLFARKFDDAVDNNIIDDIKKTFHLPLPLANKGLQVKVLAPIVASVI